MANKATYSEKLRDPRWQKKRLGILERDNFTCRGCRSKDQTLHVHHNFYKKGADPWDYDDDDLTTFCDKCHNLMELRLTGIRKIIGGNNRLTEKFMRLTQIETPISGPYDNCWGYLEWATTGISNAIERGEGLTYWEDDDEEGEDSWEENRLAIKSDLLDAVDGIYRMIFALEGYEHPNEKDA